MDCPRCGKVINVETHGYSDIGGYECYYPPTKGRALKSTSSKSQSPSDSQPADDDS